MTYTWPDGTPKSQGNAFNWRGNESHITNSKDWKQSEAAKRQMSGKPGPAFTIYSKAKRSK